MAVSMTVVGPRFPAAVSPRLLLWRVLSVAPVAPVAREEGVPNSIQLQLQLGIIGRLLLGTRLRRLVIQATLNFEEFDRDRSGTISSFKQTVDCSIWTVLLESNFIVPNLQPLHLANSISHDFILCPYFIFPMFRVFFRHSPYMFRILPLYSLLFPYIFPLPYYSLYSSLYSSLYFPPTLLFPIFSLCFPYFSVLLF